MPSTRNFSLTKILGAAAEGRLSYRRHRVRERSPILKAPEDPGWLQTARFT